jgi:hypothetical protein
MKLSAALAIILATPFLHFSSFAQELSDDLIIHYSFNEDAEDLSGNFLHGSAEGTEFVQGVNGVDGTALYFDGIDDVLQFPNDLLIEADLPVSFSFWIKFEDINAEDLVIVTNDYDENNHSGCWINGSSTGLIACGYGDAGGNTDPSNRRSKVGETELLAGDWYHIVVIIRDALDMDIWIDCENDGDYYNGSGGPMGYTEGNGNIGKKDANVSADPYFMWGTMDEFYYWGREITVPEITMLCHPDFQYERPNAILENTQPISNEIEVTLNQGWLTLVSQNHNGDCGLFDMKGQVVGVGKLCNGQWKYSTQHLPSGLYVVRVVDEYGIVSARKISVAR